MKEKAAVGESYTNMTDEEIVTADLTALVEYELAVQGVPPAGTPPKNPKDAVPQPDMTVFEIPSMMFTSEVEARKILDLALKADTLVQTEYKWGGGVSTYTVIPSERTASVSGRRYWSPDGFVKNQTALESAHKQKEWYDAELKAYKEREAAETEVRETVTMEYAAAVRRVEREAFLSTEYQRYLGLADGDPVVAKRFFTMAYRDAGDILSVGE